MRRQSQIANPLTFLFLLFWCQAALCIPPQTGMYWNPRKSGWAFYVENQNNTIFLAAYAYSSVDGEPEFYVASGPLLSGVQIPEAEPRFGADPIHGFEGDFFRVPSGACLACPYTPFSPAESIGRVSLKFYGRGGMYAKVRFNDGTQFPNPAIGEVGLFMTRFNFALGGVVANAGDAAPLFGDMRGEWVFTDQSDRLRTPWRFDFTVREENADLSDFNLVTSVAFRDVSRNAVMYCFLPSTSGLTTPQIQALPDPACELRQDGQTLFWTPAEYSIDEFVGSLGSAPPRSSATFRGPQRVLGRRISD